MPGQATSFISGSQSKTKLVQELLKSQQDFGVMRFESQPSFIRILLRPKPGFESGCSNRNNLPSGILRGKEVVY